MMGEMRKGEMKEREIMRLLSRRSSVPPLPQMASFLVSACWKGCSPTKLCSMQQAPPILAPLRGFSSLQDTAQRQRPTQPTVGNPICSLRATPFGNHLLWSAVAYPEGSQHRISAGGFRGGRCWASAPPTARLKLFSAAGGAIPLAVLDTHFVTDS